MAESAFSPLPPALCLPAGSARSRSRSPERRSPFLAHELDPLLSSLSPHATLRALTTADAVSTNRVAVQDALTKSIADVSTADRAFGIRAAVAAQKLKEWHTEVLSWLWPDNVDARLGKGFLPPTGGVGGGDNDAGEEFYGSLPASLIVQYQGRVEEIKDGMDALGVEELKEHLLDVHVPSRSRPASSASTCTTNGRPFGYVKLSDFTAVITTTILRALPILTRLNVLISIWELRFKVLRQVPTLLSELDRVQTVVDDALTRLNEDDPHFSRESLNSKRHELERMVAAVGRQMDSALDILEGHQDSLPDAWIDQIESIESKFATWVFGAGKKATEIELRRKNLQDEAKNKPNTSTDETVRSELKATSPFPPEPSPASTVDDASRKQERASSTKRVEGVAQAEDNQALSNDTPVPSTNTVLRGTSTNAQNTSSIQDIPSTLEDATESKPLSPSGPQKHSLKSKKSAPAPLRLSLLENKDYGHSPSATSIDTPVKSILNAETRVTPVVEPKITPRTLDSPSTDSSGNSVIHHPQKTDEDGSPGSDCTSVGNVEPSLGNPPSFQRIMSIPLSRFVNDNANPATIAAEDNGTDGHQPVRKSSAASLGILPKTELRSLTTKRRDMKPDQSVKPSRELRRAVSSLTMSTARQPSHRAEIPEISGLATSGRSARLSRPFAQQPKSPRLSKPPKSILTNPKPNNRASNARSDTRTPLQASNNQGPGRSIHDHTAITAQKPPRNIPRTPIRPSDDPMDEKINTILNNIPARIHLGYAPDEDEDQTGPDNSRFPSRTDRMQSTSPTPSRSSTPTPSLTLTPAYNRPKRRAPTEDDSSVRLYHLHRGGKSVPVKLFVRLVGEGGERVMVRVGGGWADLGEYLREYAMHHKRRNIAEERFEVQGIPSNYSRDSRSPTPTNGRTTPGPPSRPGSSMSARPTSSLGIRKTRRSTGANGADLPNLTLANIQRMAGESFDSAGRRLSVSSAASMSVASTAADSRYASTSRTLSTATGPTHTTPLGLAGPNPRSRQVSISPESEAWVEDLMGQARMSSSTLRQPKSNSSLRPPRQPEDFNNRLNRARADDKIRSVSDVGAPSLNKRVFLRRLSKGKE